MASSDLIEKEPKIAHGKRRKQMMNTDNQQKNLSIEIYRFSLQPSLNHARIFYRI